MIYYLLTPFAAIVLVVFQNTLADVLFSGWLPLELSLALVIYAGFRLDALQGAVFAFIVGFVFDCVSGAPPGLFAIIYLMIFIISFFVTIITLILILKQLIFHLEMEQHHPYDQNVLFLHDTLLLILHLQSFVHYSFQPQVFLLLDRLIF